MTWEEFLEFNKPEVFKEQLYPTEEIHLACLYYVKRNSKNNTMTWEEFKEQEKQKNKLEHEGYQLTSIECPKCGKPVYKNQSFCYMTNPPKYEYVCFECDWNGIA